MSASSKKNELITYHRLHLSREHKSKKNRRKVEAEKLYCYIGGNTPDRPYLKIPRREYLRLWDEMNLQIAARAPQLNSATLTDARRRQIENAVYEVWARCCHRLDHLEASFQKHHGRGMTPHEQALYARALDPIESETLSPPRRATAIRKSLIRDVVRKIEARQRHHTGKFQQVWATMVGAEVAQETFLEKIQNGVATCRCLSSTLAFKLRRDKNLPVQLSRELGMPIKKIVFR